MLFITSGPELIVLFDHGHLTLSIWLTLHSVNYLGE